MFNPQIQQFEMEKVACNLAEHKGKSIKILCLNPECKENSTLCSKCLIKGHLQCRNQVHELEDIPKQLIELLEIQQVVVVLRDMINNQFKELLSGIDWFLEPVQSYSDSPTLSNLNEIGLYLRWQPKQSLLQYIDEAKSQIRSLLNSQNCQEQIFQENEELDANDLFKEGVTLENKGKYDESIKCYETAIQIDLDNVNWENKGMIDWSYYKGDALEKLGKCDEAIDCYYKGRPYNPDPTEIRFKNAKLRRGL